MMSIYEQSKAYPLSL